MVFMREPEKYRKLIREPQSSKDSDDWYEAEGLATRGRLLEFIQAAIQTKEGSGSNSS